MFKFNISQAKFYSWQLSVVSLTQAEDSRGLYQKYSGISSSAYPFCLYSVGPTWQNCISIDLIFQPLHHHAFPLLLSSESQHSRLHQKQTGLEVFLLLCVALRTVSQHYFTVGMVVQRSPSTPPHSWQ